MKAYTSTMLKAFTEYDMNFRAMDYIISLHCVLVRLDKFPLNGMASCSILAATDVTEQTEKHSKC